MFLDEKEKGDLRICIQTPQGDEQDPIWGIRNTNSIQLPQSPLLFQDEIIIIEADEHTIGMFIIPLVAPLSS